jgi:hypothetical protein
MDILLAVGGLAEGGIQQRGTAEFRASEAGSQKVIVRVPADLMLEDLNLETKSHAVSMSIV